MTKEEQIISLLTEIRNCIRAASYPNLKNLLATALPDERTRRAYQMLDGDATGEQVRIASKMSPNKLVSLTQKWESMGLMEVTPDKKKKRLFDLRDYGLTEVAED